MIGICASTGRDSTEVTSSCVLKLASRYSRNPAIPRPKHNPAEQAEQVDSRPVRAERLLSRTRRIEHLELLADLPPLEVCGNSRLRGSRQQRLVELLRGFVIARQFRELGFAGRDGLDPRLVAGGQRSQPLLFRAFVRNLPVEIFELLLEYPEPVSLSESDLVLKALQLPVTDGAASASVSARCSSPAITRLSRITSGCSGLSLRSMSWRPLARLSKLHGNLRGAAPRSGHATGRIVRLHFCQSPLDEKTPLTVPVEGFDDCLNLHLQVLNLLKVRRGLRRKLPGILRAIGLDLLLLLDEPAARVFELHAHNWLVLSARSSRSRRFSSMNSDASRSVTRMTT